MTYRGYLAAALLVGLVVRLLILPHTSALATPIDDEHQYAQLARSLYRGDGFAWEPGGLTSLRPPLYPAFVAAIWRVSGEGNLQAVRVVQFLLSLLTSGLVYALGRRAFNPIAGGVAAMFVWLYPSLIFLNFTILAETLFTFLLVAFVLLAVRLVQQPGAWTAAGCGLLLGLAALTRSVLWPVPLALCPLLLLLIERPLRYRLVLSGLVLAGYAVVVGPWAVRNTRLQRVVTIVDTMGGMNLRMGNYEHTPEDRMWDAVSLKGDKNWVYALTQEHGPPPPGGVFTEGMKDKWAQRKAVEYMRAHPGTTLRRSAIKFGDLWGLEREFIAGVQRGLYAPPTWFVVVATGLVLSAFVTVVVLGVAGCWLAPPQWRAHLVLLLPIAVVTFGHTITFGHSRYHLPLVPILALYAAAVATASPTRIWMHGRARLIGAGVSMVLFLAIWARQIVVVDGERLQRFLGGLW